jgi:hypothetical protein
MSSGKSERHHWWPVCVSRHWSDVAGGVNWLLPDGEVRRSTPANFGVIGNGHFIKLGKHTAETTVWDQNFEHEFQQADSGFPRIIEWLDGLEREPRTGLERRRRFLPQESRPDLFAAMVEALVSLAIRSPMTRSAVVSIAEHFREPLPERERNTLIAINMRDMHRRVMQSLGGRGKAAAIFSPEREFIFGDGFYHNLTSVSALPISPRILAPLTPRMAVLYAIPTRYITEPQLSTFVIDAEEAGMLNDVVQIYASEALFYRSEKPQIIEEYRVGCHRRFNSSRNPVEQIVHDMPGVPPRDTSLDFLEDILVRR